MKAEMSVRGMFVKRFLTLFGLELLLEIVGYQGLGHLFFGHMWDSDMQSEIIIHIVWMLIISTPVLYWWVTNNVRAQVRYDKALHDSEHEFKSLFTYSSSAIVAFDSNGYITNCNPAFLDMTGYTTDEVIGHHRHEFVLPEQTEVVQSSFHKSLHGGVSEFENEIVHTDGHLLSVESVNVPLYRNNEIAGVYAILKDVTGRKRRERKMWELAHYDYLTGLPNRRLFAQLLSEALEEAKAIEHRRVGLLFLDLDRFKNINDSLGHDVGDKLLTEMGKRMSGCLGPEHLLARLGGDEFAILLPNIHHVSEAETIAKSLVGIIRQPAVIDGYELYVTSSIGVAVYPFNGDSVKQMMKSADAAMYVAKGEGKNRYRVHMPLMNNHSYRKLELERDLRKALFSQSNELYVEYQPQINVETNMVVGAEALIRWEHPKLGRLSPDEFLSLAGETGLIQSLGIFVLRKVCQQVSVWLHQNQTYHFVVTVNVSLQDFHDDAFIPRFTSAVEDYDIPFTLIGIEITETTLMRREPEVIQKLHVLRALGVKVYVDDFGRGYNSLEVLKNFPLDGLKIDRTFVAEIDTDPVEAATMEAVITLAHARDLHVIAEGVERPKQLEELRLKKCDEYQGFLHSHPVSAEHLLQYVKT